MVVHLAQWSFVIDDGVLEVFGTRHGSMRFLLSRAVVKVYTGRPWLAVAHRDVASGADGVTLQLDGPAADRYAEVVAAMVAAGAVTQQK
jgi:hypothetical protein